MYFEIEAKAIAVRMSREKKVHLNAYKCKFCHHESGACGWHIGNQVTLASRLAGGVVRTR